MTEAYKIGVTVALADLVTPGLTSLTRQLYATDKVATALTATIGVGLVAALGASVREASKFETELGKFKMYGLGDKLNEDAKNFAMNMKVAGVNFTDTMHFMNEAQGVFRQSGRNDDQALAAAKMTAPILSKIAFIDKALYHKDDASASSPESLAMLRWIDMTGGTNDTKRANELADIGFRLKTTSGGQVDWEQLRQFRARAKSAGFGVSDEMYAMLEPIIGELKGTTAGNSLSTAFNRAHGITRPPNQAVAEYLKLGLWDKHAVELNALGGIKKLKGDPLIDAQGYDDNAIKWYMDYVKPSYDKMGLNADQRIRENALLFGGTGGNMMSLFDRQSEVIKASQAAFGKAYHLDEAYAAAMQTPSGKVASLSADFDKTLTHLGEDIMPVTNAGLAAMAGTLSVINGILAMQASEKQRAHNEGRDTLWGAFKDPLGLGWSKNVVPPSQAARPDTGNLTAVINLDGNYFAKTMVKYQSDELMNPPNTGSSFDVIMTLQPVH